MPVETNPQKVEDLNPAWPLNSDQVKFGSAHLRNIKQAVRGSAFPAGTKMLFQQTNAPTGWVKDTTHNNKALRVVTGTAGSGGSNGFSNALNSVRITSNSGAHSHSITVANHTLSLTQIPNRTGSMTNMVFASNFPNTGSGALSVSSTSGQVGGNGDSRWYRTLEFDLGGGGSGHNHSASSASAGGHTHTLNLDVQYVDLIIATKQ